MIAKTALYAQHLAANAKMVDFHGWDLPLHYGSQLEEHLQVRKDAGMFDVSHMTVVDILGAGGREFLRHLLTNDVDQLHHVGKALYSCMCNEHGGIIDDLIVYQRASDNYRLVLNAATRAKDLQWIRKIAEDFSVGLQERNELAMIAVQGPNALAKTASILTPAQIDAVSTLDNFECVDVNTWFFARTGYTGEDGFEIIVPQKYIGQLWSDLLAAGIKPCGLAARDTLRLEAGMLLYGQDMDETTTPLESGLGWTVKWEALEREFIGKGALIAQKNEGLKRKFVGLVLEDKGIMRHGQQVQIPDQPSGFITSGGYSPSLACSIALARVPVQTPDRVMVDIRGRLLPARVVKPRFISKGQSLI